MNKINLAEIMPEITHGGPGQKRPLLQKEELKNACIMFMHEVYVPAKGYVQTHIHDDLEEIHYFILGVGKMLVGNEYVKIRKGDRIIVPPKQSHCIVNAGTSVMKYLCFGIKI